MGGRASQCVVGFSKLEHSTYTCTVGNRLSISPSFHWFKLGYTVQLRNYQSVVFIVLKNAIQSLTVATTQWEILQKSCIAFSFYVCVSRRSNWPHFYVTPFCSAYRPNFHQQQQQPSYPCRLAKPFTSLRSTENDEANLLHLLLYQHEAGHLSIVQRN